MRTSLNNLKEVDDHLLGLATPEDDLVFQAKMIIDPGLSTNVYWHKQTIKFMQQYGRRQLRLEIDTIHNKLFTGPEHKSLRQSILRFFKH